LTGSERDTRTLAMLLGFRFSVNAESGALTHDNKVFVLSREGALVQSFNSLDASALDDAAGAILEAAND
jgi:hypothetical protein